jgi:hypothetical protein
MARALPAVLVGAGRKTANVQGFKKVLEKFNKERSEATASSRRALWILDSAVVVVAQSRETRAQLREALAKADEQARNAGLRARALAAFKAEADAREAELQRLRARVHKLLTKANRERSPLKGAGIAIKFRRTDVTAKGATTKAKNLKSVFKRAAKSRAHTPTKTRPASRSKSASR